VAYQYHLKSMWGHSHTQKVLIHGLLIPTNVSLIASKSEVGAVIFTIRFVDVISHV
jgi:hypothetical protein